jgi:hypothetical protein
MLGLPRLPSIREQYLEREDAELDRLTGNLHPKQMEAMQDAAEGGESSSHAHHLGHR